MLGRFWFVVAPFEFAGVLSKNPFEFTIDEEVSPVSVIPPVLEKTDAVLDHIVIGNSNNSSLRSLGYFA